MLQKKNRNLVGILNFLLYACFYYGALILSKETRLERADFTLQLSMFVTKEKEGVMFIIFYLPSFCQLLSPPDFKLGQAECARTIQTNRPRRHLFLM